MISLCIISRKEDEQSLFNAVQSCFGYVDEVVIVDTSEKGKIARLGLDDHKVKYVSYTWVNDFAAARNFSFEQATGDVIFWIDSDDVVLHPDNLPKLAKKITDGEADWIYSKYIYSKDEWGNINAVHWKPRLFKKGSVKWVGSVHEDTVPTTGVIQVKDTDTEVGAIVIEHKADLEHHRSSAERNLGLLMEEYTRDGDKTDPRSLQNLGMTLQGLEKYAEALPFFQMHLKKSGSNSDKFWSVHRMVMCLQNIGEYKQAIKLSLEALSLFPEWKDAYFDLANSYYLMGDWEKCIEWTLVGFDKEIPDILDVTNELDYTIMPVGRCAEAYLNLNRVQFAYDLSVEMMKVSPTMPLVKDMHETCKKALEAEAYVRSFITVAKEFRKYDRVKAAKLFDLIPDVLGNDVRIQNARAVIVPPTVWEDKTIAIYCGDSYEDWAYPSIHMGIGGSEEAVIMMSEQLAKLGWKVTVYNRCGQMKGVYCKDESGGYVEYKPFYFFDKRDVFNVLISWRIPGVFIEKINAKKSLLWLHDILHEEAINQKIVDNVDKILFLSEWHSKNLSWIPKEKIYITNNGINPDDFTGGIEKIPYSMIWSSSYDRGLLPFMENIWPIIKKELPEATLRVCYGWQNIDKELDLIPSLKELREKLTPILATTPGVTEFGRVSHKRLAQMMMASMVYPYASEFGETCNITSMKAQAAGCMSIVTKQAGGTPERVRYGQVVDAPDIYTNKKSQVKFANMVIALMTEPSSSRITPTIEMAKEDFSWSTTAKQWHKELL